MSAPHHHAVRRARSRADRRGATLVIVIIALVIVTLTASAAAVLGRAVQADARGSAAALRARTAAEGAVATVLATWPAPWSISLTPGATDTRILSSAAGPATVRALRLDGRRFLVSAEATSAALAGPVGAAVRRVGMFAQLTNVAYEPPAALVAAGPVTLGNDAEVRAADAPPTGWMDCTTAAEPTVAAVAAPSVRLTGTARVLGTINTASSAWSPPAPERFGDITRDTLAARADIVVPGSGAVGPSPRPASGADPACVRDLTSWGEPYRGLAAVAACTGDYPVVYARGAGTLVLRGPARFQGTLLVDGSLNVIGRVEVAGLVVVGGTVQAGTGTLVVDGGLIVRGASVSLGPGSRVRRSRCAIDRAALAASRPVPLARRAWVDLVR